MRKTTFLLVNVLIASLLSAQEVSVNLIKNGSFDYNLEVRKTGSGVWSWGNFDEPLRVLDYFDVMTQPTFPSVESTTMPDYMWFQKTTQYSGRVFINSTTNTANSSRSVSLFNVVNPNTSTHIYFTESPFHHVLGQRVELNNAETYQLDFYIQNMTEIWASGTVSATNKPLQENNISKFVVGIMAQNEAENNRNYTHFEEIELPIWGDDSWKKVTVTFNIPEIIANYPGRDFSKAAIVFGMQVYPNATGTGASNGEIRIDNISLRKLPIVETPIEDALIKNGGFEQFMDFSVSNEMVYDHGPFFAPLRSGDGVYGTLTDATFPNRGRYPAILHNFPILTNVWYKHSHFSGGSSSRVLINTLSSTTSGEKCLTLYNVGGTSANLTYVAESPFNHMAVQKVELDNSKKYHFTFKYQKPDLIWASGENSLQINNIPVRIVAGIIASNELDNNKEYTFIQDLDIPVLGDEEWHDGSVEFDLPAIIVANPGRNFSNAAIFFGMQSQLQDDGVSGSKSAAINFDDVKLIDTSISSVAENNFVNMHRIMVNNNHVAIENVNKSVSIYGVSGNLIYRNSSINGTFSYTFTQNGVYILSVDNAMHKVLIQ